MSVTITRLVGVFTLVLACAGMISGCSSSNGNARVGQTTVTKASELKQNVGKQVTLVGTARYGNSAEDSMLQLRGGAVDLPAYRWPEGYVNHPVSVTATVIDSQQVGGASGPAPQGYTGRQYRAGDIKDVERWSR
jgi:hypothetical protein